MSNTLEFNSNGSLIRMHAQEIDAGSGHPAARRPAVLLLHGAGGHVDFWTARLSPFLQEGRIGLYAPHYFDRTGTTRADLSTISDGVHVPKWLETIDAATHFIASRPGVDPSRIVLAGISLGAFLALAFAAQLSAIETENGSKRIRGILELSGGLVDPYTALATAQMPPTLIVHGATDTIVPVSFAHDLDQRLTSLGVIHRTEILPNEGHWFSPAAMPRMLLTVSSFLQSVL
ncbi:MAG: alpha/beta hydrolase family protein [Janthinobacterium lividum]